jgi:hypothetical protein
MFVALPRISAPSYQLVKKWQFVKLSVSMVGPDPPLITRPLTSPESESQLMPVDENHELTQ